MKKDLMKLFSLDTRYNKKNEVNHLGASEIHLHVRPPPGVSYNVKGVKIKGGNYVGKQTRFALGVANSQPQSNQTRATTEQDQENESNLLNVPRRNLRSALRKQ